MKQEDLIVISEVAKLKNKSVQAVYENIRFNRITTYPYKVGGHTFKAISKLDLDRIPAKPR